MRSRLIMCAAGAAILPLAAQAQSDPASPSDPPPVRTATQEVERRAPELTESSADVPIGRAPNAASLIASTEGTSAVLTIQAGKPKLSRNGSVSLAFTLKAPLNAAGTEGAFVTQQGLSNKFTAGFGFTMVRADLSGPTVEEEEAIRGGWETCMTINGKSPEFPTVSNQYETEVQLRQRQTDFLAAKCPGAKGVRKLSEETLDEMAKLGYFTPGQLETVRKYRQRIKRTPLLLLNVAGSMGYNSYASLNQADFSKRKTERMPYAISVSGGVSLGRGRPYLAAGYQLRVDYEDAQKRVVCPASPTPPANNPCQYQIFDLPKENIDHSAFALMRIGGPFSIGAGTPMIEVKVAYDFQDRVWGVDMPVYFFVDKDKSLRGGVRLSWEERGNDPEKDTLRFGIFVVKELNPFN